MSKGKPYDTRRYFAQNCPFVLPALLLAFIIVNYYIFVFITILDRMKVHFKSTVLVLLFNVSFIMFLVTFIVTARSDPGSVPRFYNYYNNIENGSNPAPQNKVCKVCQAAKPERCHHCSICGKCVLNMDHHCPWVNNCIGYQNKKFFILMLTYIVLTVLIAICGAAYEVFILIQHILDSGFTDLVMSDYLLLGSFASNVVALYNVTKFLMYHLDLVKTNRTTLEDLDLQRGKQLPEYSQGSYSNYLQVCGEPNLIWLCPFFTQQSSPTIDGFNWPRRPQIHSQPVQSQPQQLDESYLDNSKSIHNSSFQVSPLLNNTLLYPVNNNLPRASIAPVTNNSSSTHQQNVQHHAYFTYA